MKFSLRLLVVLSTLALVASAIWPASRAAQDEKNTGHPAFMSPQASPIVVSGNRVFVANTPAGTLDVIDAKSRRIVKRITVGVEPVSVAVRPDGKEVWVANHVSDSVSVVDTDSKSPTYLQVLATIQDIDPATKATRFDEPVGIAFASNEKAYVALSSANQIAVIGVKARQLTKRLAITAQDPRALVVKGDKLYVLPFESGNQTQLSGGVKPFDNKLVTFDAYAHSIFNNNVLSVGHVVDIVKHPKVPDRDLYIFDIKTDTLVETVSTLGTLLYGLTVDSKGRVFIAQTDARNDANGRSGTKKHGMKELENRPFLNRITCVAPSTTPAFFDLEPALPNQPTPDQALATPFAVQVSDDDSILIASAAGSDKLFTVDAKTGAVLGRADVGAVPQGIALEPGKLSRAWVLNAAANTVSVVEVANPANPTTLATIALYDPTHPAVKRGRIAFTTAKASSNGTFSCASCHPDGHTDQLLWVLDTPIVTGGNQIMPRSTMPVRGLRDTAPFHWDGIPGDPYGGNNSAHVFESVAPNSRTDDPLSSPRQLIDSGLASTMKLVGDNTKNDEGKLGRLTKAERDDMAKFLLSIPYPPAPERAYTNTLSKTAQRGFALFHVEGDNDPSKPKPNVCGDCHRMPFLVSTNTPGTGMDAPTWRGAYDRWLILPQGRLNLIGFDFYKAIAEQGTPERDVWRMSWGGRPRFDPIWNMVTEGSTGFSGAFARQVTLSQATAKLPETAALLEALEQSAREGGTVLQGEGILKKKPVTLRFNGKSYSDMTRAELITSAAEGRFIGTLTAQLGPNVDFDHPQPALWTYGPIQNQRGHEIFPLLYPGSLPMKLSGRHVKGNANIIVDGRRVEGTVKIDGEMVTVALAKLPPVGVHFLQLQNPSGLFSNDFIFHVADDAKAAKELLIEAMVYGDTELAKNLLAHGADPNVANDDGNTPLHIAAFFCRAELVELLLKNGAELNRKNPRGETAAAIVSGAWSKGLGDFYAGIADSVGIKLDLKQIEQGRPRIIQRLQGK
ncbi:ankyrin repeat domain-containing protein [Armatimonas sp.]|uniref:ankyrin repeat domain-containing protein n=1 Tax=Armatimonas sp. TaxID=1872638 RepID=UPI00374D233C